jgi:hypothetical protein
MRIAVFFATAVLVLAQNIAGAYKGTWSGSTGGGDFHLAVKSATIAEVGFVIEGQEVPCKVVSLKVDGSSIDLVYEFDLQGNKLKSAIKGTLKGKTLEGTYKTTASDQPVDEGTWKTTAQ